ncbi:putative thioredoxin domain-containing protein 12-like, partial [Apostichopus japonicus]
MALHEFGFLVVCISLGGLAMASAESLARGFGDNIAWKKLDEGLSLSKESNKPLMLVIHKSWCGACKALKPKFASSLAIENMSPEFVMVNVE